MSLSILKKRREFLSTASKKQVYRSKNVVIQYDENATELKFGFTATKKIGGSVVRNFARRRLRENARIISNLSAYKELIAHFVFIATHLTTKCDFKELVDDSVNGVSFLLSKYKDHRNHAIKNVEKFNTSTEIKGSTSIQS